MKFRDDRGLTLVELVIALVILGITGVVLINAMTSSSSSANKAISKTASFYAVTTAADAYSSFPYSNSNCSASAQNPYADAQARGAVDSNVKVRVQTLINNVTSGSSSEWKWVTCGVPSEWSALSDATRANINDAYAGVQKILLTYQLGSSTCPDPEQAQPNRCLTRTILKSDNNRNTPFTTVGSFRVWPTSAINLVTTESRLLGLKVVGIPSSTDQVSYLVSSVSPGLTVSPKSDVGVTVVAGSSVTGATPFSFKVAACDATISIARSNPVTSDPAVACAQNTAFVSAQTTIFVNVYQKLTLGCPVTGCLFSGNSTFASPIYQLSATGGNGQPITFSTSANPAAYVLTSDGKFNWTAVAPASQIQDTYDNLIANDVPITISQPGLTSTVTSIKVKLFSNPRFIAPAQPPLPAENIFLNANSTAPYVLKAVGGDPTLNLAFSTPTSSPVTLTFLNNTKGVSSANMILKAGQNVGRYSVPVTLSGAGWPSTNSPTFTLATIVKPVINDPGLIESSTGTASSSTLSCTCTGSTSNTFKIGSGFTRSGISLSSSGVLSWNETVPEGTYTIPITVTSTVASGTFESNVRNVQLALYPALRITQPTPESALTFDYGSTVGQTVQAQGGKPSQQIAITLTPSASSTSNYQLGTLSGPVAGVTSTTLIQKTGSFPAVGQSSVFFTLSGASASTVNTSITVRVRPVLTSLSVSRMSGFVDSASVAGACTTSCATATATRYSLDSSFTTSGISLASNGLLSWTDSVPAGTYTIPIKVSAAGSNGIYVDSAVGNITLVLTPKLTLTSPTSSQTLTAAVSGVSTFTINAYGGDGVSTALFSLKNSSTYFAVSTVSASYNASTLTSVGTFVVGSSTPAGNYTVTIVMSGAGTSQNVEANINVNVRTFINSTTCTAFQSTTSASPCRLTISYPATIGSGMGIKLMAAPTNNSLYVWSNSAGNTNVPFPTLGGTNSLALSFWRKTSGNTSFCSSSVRSGSFDITVQDAGSTATFRFTVSVVC